MSKRGQATQGGEDRYGGGGFGTDEMADKPVQANAAQMARRKIAQVKKTGASARSSRANTPTANPFAAPQQQSMSAFKIPQQGGDAGGGGGFNFSVSAPSNNPFHNANGASGTPPPLSFGMNQQPQQQNGGSGLFGNNTTSFGSTFGSNASAQPQQNGFAFGQSNTANGNSTPTFGGFGQSSQAPAQQNSATPAPATPSFNFGQTNGTSSQPPAFGQSQQQPTQSTASTSFGSFGQKPQTNGEKPATPSFGGFGQSQQQAKDKPATPAFGGFGQSAQQNTDKPASPSFQFGQSAPAQPQANGNKAPMFGATPQTEQASKPSTGMFSFNSQNKGIGNKSIPDPASKPAETPKAPMSNLFGAQQSAAPSTGKSLFGATPPPQESSATPKPGESIFSAQSKPKLGGNLFTSEMAEGKKPETAAPMFGQQTQQNGQAAADADQTPKASNLFGSLGQSQENAVQDTPKPSSDLFSTSTFGQTAAQQQNGEPKNLFGQSVQDMSMHTPGGTPQKSSLFKPAESQQAASASQPPAAASETPAQGRSLFDRISKPEQPPASAQKAPETPAFAPSTNNLFNAQPPQSAPSSNLFGKQSDTQAPSAASQPQTSDKQPSTSFQPSQPAFAPKTSSTLADVIPDNEKETFKVLNEGLAAHLAKQDPAVDWTTIMEYYLQQAAIIRQKPAPNLSALNSAPSSAFAQQKAQQPQAPAHAPTAAPAEPPLKKPTPFNRAQASAPRPSQSEGSSSGNIFGSSSSATPKAPASFQRNLSSESQQTPKPSFLQPPATAPVNRKRSAEEQPERPPATEKRARANDPVVYPKLPDNASDTAKNFLAGLERPGSASPAPFGQAKPSDSANKDQQASGFKPPTAQPKSSASGFAPSTSGFTPSTSGFKPTASGFAPSIPSSGSSNFLSAFGKKANKQSEKDRKKRKDEDFDSDEETEEQWAERDRKEQEAKKAKALEAAKASTGFVFKSTSNSAEKNADKAGPEPSKEAETSINDKEQDKPAETGQGQSLFDRISKPTSSKNGTSSPFGSQPPASKPPSSNMFGSSATPASKPPSSNIFGSSATPAKFGTGSSLFGHLSKPAGSEKAPEGAEKGDDVEKQTQGSGDNTWKPATPIKFGASTGNDNASTTPAAPPQAFGNLFGTKSQDSASNSTGHLNVPSARSSTGFTFGAQPSSADASRATTPGVTTDGEGGATTSTGEADNNEPSDDPPVNERQVEDMTGLSAEETANEAVLHQVAMSKASKWDEKKDDSGNMTHGWVDKGKGPLYILKNNESGKVRIVLKVPPYGAAKMNFPPLKGGGYVVQGKAGKQVIGTFYDHLSDKPGLGRWLVQVGRKEDADEIGRILKEEGEK